MASHFLLVQNQHYLCIGKRKEYTLGAELVASSKLMLTLKAAHWDVAAHQTFPLSKVGFLPPSSFAKEERSIM